MPDSHASEWSPPPGACAVVLAVVAIAQPLLDIDKMSRGAYALWFSCVVGLVGGELRSLHIDRRKRAAESAKEDAHNKQVIAMLMENQRNGKLALDAAIATREAVERGLPEDSLKVRALNASGEVFEALFKTLPDDVPYSYKSKNEETFQQYRNRVVHDYSSTLNPMIVAIWNELSRATERDARAATQFADRVRDISEQPYREGVKSLHQAVLEAKMLEPTSPAVIREIGERLLEAAKKLPDQ